MIGVLTCALRDDTKSELWTPGDEEELLSNEDTAVTAVTSFPVVSRPCIFWAEGEL